MSNYRRLISYIYAYEGGVKGKNIGFAKLETRGTQCKIGVNVKNVYVGSKEIGVFLLTENTEVYLGNIFIRGGAGEFRTAVSCSDVEHSGFSLDECYGLTVHEMGDAWQCCTTIWEDAVAHAAEVDLGEVTSENRIAREMENATPGTEAVLPEKHVRSVVEEIEREVAAREERAEEQEKNSGRKEAEGAADQAAADKGIPDKGIPDKGVPDKGVPDEGVPDKGVPDEGIPSGDERAGGQELHLAGQEESGEPGLKNEEAKPSGSRPQAPWNRLRRQGPVCYPAPSPAPSENGDAGQSQSRQTQPEAFDTGTDPARMPPAAEPDNAKPDTGIPAAEPETPFSGPDRAAEGFGAELEPEPAPSLLEADGADELNTGTAPEDKSLGTGIPAPDKQEEEKHEEIWGRMKREHVKLQAFDYEKGCEILSIKPQDIGLMPRENWIYGNNSFLLHGYYNYRYLVLARLNNPEGKPRYLLGIPGHYYNNEKYMASMFGFPNFVLCKRQPDKSGRFGYWYTDISLGN